MEELIVRNELLLQTRLAAGFLQVSAESAYRGIVVRRLEMSLDYGEAVSDIVEAHGRFPSL